MAVAYVDSTISGASDSFTTSKNCAIPSSTQANDIIVLIAESSDPVFSTVTWPSGFTQIGSIITVSGADETQNYAFAWKRSASGEGSGNYSVGFNKQVWNQVMCIAFRGVISTGTPYEDVQTSSNTSGTSETAVSVTTTDKDFLLFILSTDSSIGAVNFTPPTGFTEVQDTDYMELAYLEDTTSGTRTASGGTITASRAHSQTLIAFLPEPTGGGGGGDTGADLAWVGRKNMAHIQSTSNTGNTASSTIVTSYTSDNISGNTLILFVAWSSAITTSVNSVADTAGNTWVQIGSAIRDTTNFRSFAYYYVLSAASGPNTVTVTFSRSTPARGLVVAEYSDITVLDQGTGQTTTNTTADDNATTGSVTTTGADQIIAGFLATTNGVTMAAGTSPNVFNQRISIATDVSMLLEDFVQSSSGVISPTATIDTAGSYVAFQAAFTYSGGGAGGVSIGYMVPGTGSTTNLISGTNADFESGLGQWSNWFSASPSQSSVQAHSGTYSLKIVASDSDYAVETDAGTPFSASPGPLTVRYWGMRESGTTTSSLILLINWVDSGNGSISQDEVDLSSLTTSWTQASDSVTAPAGTAGFWLQLGATGATGDVIYADDFFIG